MNTGNKHLFNLLKQEIANTFSQKNSVSSAIEDWKGEDIVNFQEDLFSKTKGKVSEKWFYTYIKKTPEKLPRIDVLNLLSTYVGYNNWNAFKAENNVAIVAETKKTNFKSKLWLLLIAPIYLLFNFITSKNTFEFCFVDDIKNEKITTIPLDIKILQNNESPIYLKTDSLGCFTYETRDDVITFIVQSPYHKTDTIVRNIASNKNQTVKLKPDDYALMLHFYTNGNIKDWKKHSQKLRNLIASDVKIYRLFENSINVELYTKEEFINMLTIPTKSLKGIKVLDKTLKDGKIVTLKFIVK